MEDLQREIEQLRVEVKALEETNKELDKENDDLRQDVKDLQNEIDEKDSEIKELKSLSNDDSYFEPNYEYEGIGRIYIRCDNLSDQQVIESALSFLKRIQ